MPDISTIKLPPPSSWDEFEDICADLFCATWEDIHTDRYGRSGQRQNGVDIHGKPGGLSSGVQCKGKQKWPQKKLTISDINSEVANALEFKPKLNELIFATTAPNDVTATDRANEITEEHLKKGLFSVHVWSWDKIVRELTKHNNLIEKYYSFTTNAEFKHKVEELIETVGNTINSNALPTEYADVEIKALLKSIVDFRYLRGFDVVVRVTQLLEKLLTGSLKLGSPRIRSDALGWCARLLAKPDFELARRALAGSRELGSCDATIIGEAFIVAENGNRKKALGILNNLATPSARSAALTLVSMAGEENDGHMAALKWMESTGLHFTDFDNHGQIRFLLWRLGDDDLESTIREAAQLTEDEFNASPVLRSTWAMLNLKSIVPKEFRDQLEAVPFELREFPLSMTEEALKNLRRAKKHFQRFSQQVIDAGFPEFSRVPEELALWLKIRDPETREQGIEDLKRHFTQTEDRLRYLKFAMDFGLQDLDFDAIALEIDRVMSLSGNTSSDAALARLYLAFTQKSPAAVADYIDHHRSDIIDHIAPLPLAHIEIEMLSRAGRIREAKEVLADIAPETATQINLIKLQRVISEGQGSNAVALRIKEFEETDSLSTLMNLLDELKEQDDQTQIAKYARLYFEQVPSENNLSRLVSALYETGERKAAYELIEQNPDFVARSLYLKKMKGLVLYELGQINDAQTEITVLSAEVDDPEVREIEVRISIASGNWERLTIFVEQDWSNRKNLSVSELMQAALLAKSIDSNRLIQFLVEATSRKNPSAELLVSAYHIATSAGLEDEANEKGWLADAIKLSDDDGPVRRISLPELGDINPDWEEQQIANWRAVKSAEHPMYLSAHLKNNSLCEQMLIPSLANLDEFDPRKRSLIYTHCGVPKVVSDSIRRIMMEPTALITMMLLDLYDEILDAFDEIYLSHTTLAWLLEERQRVRFHQPSQIDNARKTRDLFQISEIEKFKPNRAFNSDLAFDVGRSLSDMIVEASVIDESNSVKKYVIRSSPVHRITNLLSQNVDLAEYSSVLVSCAGLVHALQSNGWLTEETVEKALTFLKGHEERWPNEPAISPDAKLYLDGLSVTYLLPFGILEKAAQAGYKIYIEDEETKLVSQLLKYSGVSNKAGDLIETLRKKLAEGISSSRIKLAPLPRREERGGKDFQISQHPSTGILEPLVAVDAIVSDDRYFNKFGYVSAPDGNIPVLTSSDLFNSLILQKLMSKETAWSHRITMRQAGYMLMDLDTDELLQFVHKAKMKEGNLVETAELRAIRENWQSAKMFKAAILPNDAQWLHQIIKNIDAALKAQWSESISDENSRARSDWLLSLRDLTGWTSAFEVGPSAQLPEFMAELQVLTLLAPESELDEVTKERYWSWVESAILDDLRINEPITFGKIVSMVSEGLISSANRISGEDK